MKEKFNSLRHFEKKHFNSLSQKERLELFESSLKKRFIQRGSIRWVKSYFLKKKFNSESHSKKSSILWVISEKVESSESYWRISILWVVFKKKFNVEKMSFSKKKKFNSVSSIEKIQFCESYSYFKKIHFKNHCEKRVQFLWVMLKKGFNFYESCWKKSVQFCELYSKKRFNSVNEIQKKFNSLSHFFWKNLIRFKSVSHKKVKLFDFFLVKKTKSLSHVIKKGSILRVILKKSLSHIEKKKFSSLYRIFGESSILWVVFFFWQNSKIQFFDSCSKKKKSILRVMLKKVQFIESCSTKSEFDSLSHTPKRGRFYSFSHAQKKTILWVTF